MIQGKREVWIGKPRSKQTEGNRGYEELGCNTHNRRTAPLTSSPSLPPPPPPTLLPLEACRRHASSVPLEEEQEGGAGGRSRREDEEEDEPPTIGSKYLLGPCLDQLFEADPAVATRTFWENVAVCFSENFVHDTRSNSKTRRPG